jgi:hypothetical protein
MVNVIMEWLDRVIDYVSVIDGGGDGVRGGLGDGVDVI